MTPGFSHLRSRPPSRPGCRPGPPGAPLFFAEALEPRLCLTTWYVAPGGSDIAPGTIGAPLASLAVASARARAGDVVLARAGIYDPNASQLLGAIGAADGRISFQAYPGETPIIDGSSLPAGTPLIQITGQYLDFRGFEVRHAKGAGVAATGQHLQIVGNTVDGAAGQGVLVGTGSDLTTTTDVLVQDNFIYNDNLVAPPAPPAGTVSTVPRPAAAEAYGASDVSFTGNYVHDNHAPGIELVLLADGSVAGNVVHDNTGANVVLDNVSRSVVNQNFLYNTSEAAFYTNGAPAVSILLSNGAYPLSNPLDALLIENNIALSSSTNLAYVNVRTPSSSDPGLKDSTIANNLFYSGGGSSAVNLQVDFSPGHSNDLVVDNIFYESAGTQVVFGTNAGTTGGVAPDGFTFQANNWFNGGRSVITHGGAPSAAGPGDVYSDPRLVDPGTIDPAGYKLLPDSPDIDAGVAVTGVTSDYYGVPRPQGKFPDIGAHELVTAPPPPTAVPAPPGVPPGVPTGFAAVAPSPYEIDLTWGDYVTPLAGFAVQRRGNGDWIPLGYGSAGPANDRFNVSGTFADTGLKPNHRYTYRVVAFFADNTLSQYSRPFSFKTPKKPKVPKPRKPPKAVKAGPGQRG